MPPRKTEELTPAEQYMRVRLPTPLRPLACTSHMVSSVLLVVHAIERLSLL